jgi:hypothetical protein
MDSKDTKNLSTDAKSDVPVAPPPLSGKTVTMVFPAPVTLTTAYGVVKYEVGPNEVPEEHAEHWYLKAHGVLPYKGSKLEASAPLEDAPTIQEWIEANQSAENYPPKGTKATSTPEEIAEYVGYAKARDHALVHNKAVLTGAAGDGSTVVEVPSVLGPDKDAAVGSEKATDDTKGAKSTPSAAAKKSAS